MPAMRRPLSAEGDWYFHHHAVGSLLHLHLGALPEVVDAFACPHPPSLRRPIDARIGRERIPRAFTRTELSGDLGPGPQRGPSDSISASRIRIDFAHRIAVRLELERPAEGLEGVLGTVEPDLGLGHSRDRTEVIRISRKDLLAILNTFGESALKEVDDGPLVIRLGEVRAPARSSG